MKSFSSEYVATRFYLVECKGRFFVLLSLQGISIHIADTEAYWIVFLPTLMSVGVYKLHQYLKKAKKRKYVH